MAVGANTYGTVAGVERLIGDLIDSRTFSGSTVPSTTQVEAELDAVAADLNRELEANDFTVPVAVGDDPTDHAFLAAANNYGAAAVLLATVPFIATNPDQEEFGTNRAEMYARRLNHALKEIRAHRISATKSTGRMARMFAGSQEDDDGNTKKPLFVRGIHDFPGARSLTE